MKSLRRITTHLDFQGETSQLTQWLAVGLVTLALAVLEYVGLLQGFRSWGERLAQPVLTLGVTLIQGVRYPYVMVMTSHQAVQRIRDLELQYSRALAELGQLQQLKAENLALRNMLENTDRKMTNTIVTAPILSYGTPFVAAGSAVGVQPGAMVLVAQTLVGVVDQVTEHQAAVLLLTQSQARPVLAETEDGVAGLVKGTGSNIIFTEVSQDQELKVGQRIVTTGQKGIESGILVGVIRSIDQTPSAPTQTAFIDQTGSFFETKLVEIRQ